MNELEKAARQALEVLEENHHLIEEHERPEYLAHYDRVISGVSKALEQPAQKRPQNCGTGYCSCIECVMEPEHPEQHGLLEWSDEQLQMLNFLYGAGEFDGAWFDEKHPTEKAAFWWRKHLRRLFDARPQARKPEQPAQEPERDRVIFERHWRKTRGEKKANRELPRHPLQPQIYIQDSANRHWVTWQAALRYAARPQAPATPLHGEPLTEKHIKHLWYEACQTNIELTSQLIVHLARAIEAAHGITSGCATLGEKK